MPEAQSPKENVLTLRARRLAERTTTDAVTTAREPILIFRLGDERFAVRMKFVANVVPFERVTPVPTSGPDLLGVMAIRGEIHAVYAFDRVLELPRAGAAVAGEGHVLALRHVGRQIGVRVDRVESIDQIAARAPGAEIKARAFVTPVTAAPLILIEDLETLFNSIARGENQ